MPTPRVTIWSEAPKLALPESPSLLVDSRSILLAYETAGTKKDTYAVVRFTDVIDHRLSPINDEGLGKHAYAKFGLEWYSFVSVRPGSYLASIEAAICEAYGDHAHEPMVTMCVTAVAASSPATEASGRLDWSCVAAV